VASNIFGVTSGRELLAETGVDMTRSPAAGELYSIRTIIWNLPSDPTPATTTSATTRHTPTASTASATSSAKERQESAAAKIGVS
jgi:hypothetical protein